MDEPTIKTGCGGTEKFARELENFEEIAAHVVPSPGDIPLLNGLDIYGRSLPLDGIIGGDHIIYLDFKSRFDLDARIEAAQGDGRSSVVENLRRCKGRGGIALADVSGHRITDGLLALMLHQAFLLGAIYELDFFGEITTRLFENLNSRFFKSSSVGKYLTLIYGEISEHGKFRFISAAHPIPIVYSRKYDRFVEISETMLTTFPPIGTMPSSEDIDRSTASSVLPFKARYEVNEINLMGSGDILILYSDGLSEHSDGVKDYFPGKLEATLRDCRETTAEEIFQIIHEDLLAFGKPQDDISYVIIKKT